MASKGGSHDDRSAEEIDQAVQDALAQQQLEEFWKVAFQCEVTLVVAQALLEDD